MNKVIITGRLTRDPELKYLPTSGTAVANFGMAVDKDLSRKKKQELEEGNQATADFLNIIVWQETAEFAANNLYKGQRIGIEGRIESRSWKTQDGSTKTIVEIKAERIEPYEWRKAETDFTPTTEKTPWE